MRSWLTPPTDPNFDAKVADGCIRSRDAPRLTAQGERVLSTDELTGVQALERKHPGSPRRPGQVERQEFASVRHGTCAFILNRDVASGEVVAPSCGPTRTEADFAAHVAQTVASDPVVTRWPCVVDNLDLHQSTTLVRFVATASGLEVDLGKKGTRGILANRRSRAACLSDPAHRIVFHSTPVHRSWLNQIARWLSILARTVLKRGSFPSVADLIAPILAFIADDTRTAKPFTWTYQGKPLLG